MKKLMTQRKSLESTFLKGMLLTSFVLSSCDSNDDNLKQTENQASKGEVKKGSFLDEEITYVRKDGRNVFQGDMLITDEQLENNQQGRGAVRKTLRWPNNTVYYNFSNSLLGDNRRDLRFRIHNAIKEFENKTNVKWVYNSSNISSVVFETNGHRGNGGAATVGRQLGRKAIILYLDASLGVLLHEMGHTIGLFHEQSRRDRDNHITINWNNIQDGHRNNFYKYNQSFAGFFGVDIGPFDINSIMMYDSYSFSKNGQPTIVLKNGNTYNHNLSGFSQSDIVAINRMYRRR